MDKVTVANSALLKLGASPISDIDEDSDNGRRIRACFDRLNDEVTGAYPWKHALKRTSLYALAEAPAFEFTKQMDLPSDCLHVLEVYPDGTDFTIEDHKLLCDQEEIQVKYIRRNTPSSNWENAFCEALAWRIAMELCYAINNSSERLDACTKAYKAQLADARFLNARQASVKVLVSDQWTQARR